jgi:tetratricopeptide (TPR) repeat protein
VATTTFTMSKKPILIAVAGIAIVAALAGAWWWQQANRAYSLVAKSLPVTPDLSATPNALRTQVAVAESDAHTHFGARAGLARLSQIYHANGFLGEAMQCYAGLEQLEPSEPRWLHLHASILAGYGETDPAIALWQRTIALAPNYLPAQLRLGDCQLKSNRPAEATATYASVLQKDPANAYALLGLARLDYEASRWDKAQERLETVVKQTNYALGYDLIVTLYERSGQTERAIAIRGANKASGAFRDPPDPWLDDLMDACFDPYRLALSAGFIARNGDPAKAVRLLERAIELAPDDVSSRFQLGTLSASQGNNAVAREQLERCTRLAPDFADGWAQLSALQAKLGDSATAARILATGLVNCPQSPGLHLMRARTLQKAGASNEAIAEYRESIRLRPNEAEAYIELGNYYINLGRIEDSVPLLQQSLEAEPANPMALSILTFYAISTGDESTALRWFSKVRNQPRVPSEQVAKLRAAFQEQFGHPLR